MGQTAQITTTEQEIIIRIPRVIVEQKRPGHVSITHLRGLMKRSKFANMGSVAAQHAATIGGLQMLQGIWVKHPRTAKDLARVRRALWSTTN